MTFGSLLNISTSLEKKTKSNIKNLTLSDGTKIRDPYGHSNNWKNDVSLLQDTQGQTCTTNLIDMPSAYTHENLKLINHLKLLISLYAIMLKMCSIILFQKN